MSDEKTTAIVLLICALILAASVRCFAAESWMHSTLNEELVNQPLPTYTDENTTLRVIPTAQSFGFPVQESGEDYVSSDMYAAIKMNWSMYGSSLNICYMEVLVYNSSDDAERGLWSLNLTSGSKNGLTSSDPHYVCIPPRIAGARVFFRLHLVSTDFNYTNPVVFSTPTLLNEMCFNYTVYYNDEELAIDRQERLSAGNHLTATIVLLLMVSIAVWKAPDENDECSDNPFLQMYRIPITDASSWLRYIAGRVDYVELQRHNQIIEAEILLGILGGIVTVSGLTDPFLLIPVLILSTPLVFAIIVLFLGAVDINSDELASTNPTTVLLQLRFALRNGGNIVKRTKVWVAAGSFYGIELILLLLFPPVAKYHIAWLQIIFIINVFLFLSLVFLLAMGVKRMLTSESDDDPYHLAPYYAL